MPIRAFSPLRRLLIGGLLAGVASALLPWSEALADDAKTLRIGYQKFNSINILKGSGALEKASLVEDADEYCKRRGKSAVVIASSENDAKPGTLAAPGKLARATVEFRCQ